jgi:hypothetical protein
MIIIGGGRIQAQGTRAKLLPWTGTIVEAGDLDGLDAALRRAAWHCSPSTEIGDWSTPSRRRSPARRWPTVSCCAGSPRPRRPISNASSSS